MLTLKMSVASAVLVGAIAATAGATYVATKANMHVSVSCPPTAASEPAPTRPSSAARRTCATEPGQDLLMRRGAIPALVALAAISVAAAHSAHAQSTNTLDQIVDQFRMRSAGWESTLQSFARGTFGILAGIELVWASFKLAFRGADVSEWLAEIVNQILFLGFFFALLENSVTWGQAIVDSFRQAAGAAGGGGIAPSNVFAAGV